MLIPLVFYTDIVHVPPDLIDEFMRRTVVPGDVIDRLISSGLSGVPFTNEDVTKVATILLIGRTDTIRNVITNALWFLAHNPDLRQQLVDDPGLMPKAVEEFPRLLGSVQLVGRTVMKEVTVGPATVSPGQKVVMSPAAADRDPAMFPDPATFNLHRSPNPHLAFGVGVHRCLGSNRGRMEIKVALEVTLERLPRLRDRRGRDLRALGPHPRPRARAGDVHTRQPASAVQDSSARVSGCSMSSLSATITLSLL